MDESIPLVGCLVCGLARIHGFRGAQLFGTARKEEKFKIRIYFMQIFTKMHNVAELATYFVDQI